MLRQNKPSRLTASACVVCFAVLFFFCNASPVPAAKSVTWSPLMSKLKSDGFSSKELKNLFSRPEVVYDSSAMGAKISTLYKRKFGFELVRKLQARLTTLGYKPGKADGRLGANTRRAIRGFEKVNKLPITGKATQELLDFALLKGKKAPAGLVFPQPPARGPRVYKSIINPERLGEALAFYKANQPLLKRFESTYGIPGDVAVGILTVETRLGTYLGEASAFITLASMARTTDYSLISSYLKDERLNATKRHWLNKRIRQKSSWAYNECRALLKYARANKLDPLKIPGSVYGAIGVSQFMPSNALKFGVDGDGDGVVDLFVLEDAVFSMGNYLRAAGWKGRTKNRKQQRKAIYRYNHSTTYVNTVFAVADHVKKGK